MRRNSNGDEKKRQESDLPGGIVHVNVIASESPRTVSAKLRVVIFRRGEKRLSVGLRSEEKLVALEIRAEFVEAQNWERIEWLASQIDVLQLDKVYASEHGPFLGIAAHMSAAANGIQPHTEQQHDAQYHKPNQHSVLFSLPLLVAVLPEAGGWVGTTQEVLDCFSVSHSFDLSLHHFANPQSCRF